jgi:membrane protease YdiL (CAAX protease family)
MAVIFEGGLGVVALLLGWWWGYPPAAAMDTTWLATGQGIVASLPMLGLFLICLYLPLRPLVNLRQMVDKSLVPMFRHCQMLEILVISVLAGLGEEMLFRGVLQPAIGDWYGDPGGPWVGLAVSAVLFGLLHPLTPTYAVLAGTIGLYLGLLQMMTKNLFVPITTHAAYDFLALTYLVKLRSGNESPDEKE